MVEDKKEQLLNELAQLGQHQSGRKVRSDKGKSRGIYAPRSDIGQSRGQYAPRQSSRSDKGKSRGQYASRSDIGQSRGQYASRSDIGSKRDGYSKKASFHKKAFQQFLLSNTTEYGDTLFRDANMIFPPNITNYYKRVTTKTGQSYRSSVSRKNHPELLRWRWWFAEWLEAGSHEEKKVWTDKICDWYFIHSDELDLWTYNEWAWAYYKTINGNPNRGNDRIILSYGIEIPTYDEKGEMIWPK